MAYKRYVQPYNSRHVINNTTDSTRAEEQAYIKNFPRLLHALYRKQTPFNLNLLANVARSSRFGVQQDYKTRSSSRKSEPTRSAERTNDDLAITPKRNQQNTNFKTLASTVPSDFEHIFHYSETQ